MNGCSSCLLPNFLSGLSIATDFEGNSLNVMGLPSGFPATLEIDYIYIIFRRKNKYKSHVNSKCS